MSGNLPETRNYQVDFSTEDIQALEAFNLAGRPNVARISETEIFSWFNLYMSGRTYQEIAKETKADINHVLFIADKYVWAEKKDTHFANIMARIQTKMDTVKLEGVSFLYDLLSFTHALYSEDIIEFIKTKDKAVAARVDLKIVDKYTKIVDAINKLTESPEDWLKSKTKENTTRPIVNVNIENANIQQKDNEMTIDVGSEKSMVSKLAELKKKKETESK